MSFWTCFTKIDAMSLLSKLQTCPFGFKQPRPVANSLFYAKFQVIQAKSCEMMPESYVTESRVAKKSFFDLLLFFESWLVWVRTSANSCRTPLESQKSQLSRGVCRFYGPFFCASHDQQRYVQRANSFFPDSLKDISKCRKANIYFLFIKFCIKFTHSL